MSKSSFSATIQFGSGQYRLAQETYYEVYYKQSSNDFFFLSYKFNKHGQYIMLTIDSCKYRYRFPWFGVIKTN
jgi:hypothetical protein